MKSILKKISSVVVVLTLLAGAFVGFAKPAAATTIDFNAGIGGVQDSNYIGNGQQNNLTGSGGVITTIINIMLFVIGIACVIMIVYGGIRYTISRGEPEAVKSAKNTILYAIVGLVIAILAYAIVNFVIGGIGANNS